MRLSVKQRQFAEDVGKLIAYIYKSGYEVTLGDAYRDHRVFGKPGTRKGYGQAYSNHKMRLAIDLNLFVKGKYITNGDHPAYKQIGEWWEKLRPGNAWGGRFNDANHFSREHNGRK